MVTKQKKQKSLWYKFKNKVSKIIPDSVKHGFKRFGVIVSFFTLGAMGASANTSSSAAPEKNLTDSITTIIKKNYHSMPSDAELEKKVTELAYSEYGRQLVKNQLHDQTDSLSKALSIVNNKIQSQMTRTRSRKNTRILNEYLGLKNLGIVGNSKLTSQNAPSASCSWAGNRSIYYAAEQSNTEHLVNSYFDLLGNVNYAWAAYGFRSEMMKDNTYKNLLHTSKTDKKLKQSLENDVKEHPTDIFIVFERSPRAKSGCHFIVITGEEAYSYNNQSISSSAKRIKNMKQKGYFNLSEYIRQKVDQNAELEKIVQKVCQDVVANKTDIQTYLVSKICNYAPTTENTLFSDLATDLTLNNITTGTKSSQIIQEWQNSVHKNNQNALTEILASSAISEERKEEIKNMHESYNLTPQRKDTKITEEEALQKVYFANSKASAKAIKKLKKEKSLSTNERFLCLHAITTLLAKGGYIQQEDQQAIMATVTNGIVRTADSQVKYNVTAQEDIVQLNWEQSNLTKDQKIQQITKKKTSWKRAKKASKMAMKRLEKERKSLADIRAAKKRNLSQTAITKQTNQRTRNLGS